MRIVGLVFLVLGVLFYLVPTYQDLLPFARNLLAVVDTRVVAAILVVLGLLSIFVSRRDDGS